jgi:hypothetical protein
LVGVVVSRGRREKFGLRRVLLGPVATGALAALGIAGGAREKSRRNDFTPLWVF